MPASYYTGVNQGIPHAFVQQSLSVRQNKTSKELWVPILPELQSTLDQSLRHSVYLLTNAKGTKKWSYRGASQAVRKVREVIGALDFDTQSWRYNAACELVEAGCGDDLLASVTGQSPAMSDTIPSVSGKKFMRLKRSRSEQNKNRMFRLSS